MITHTIWKEKPRIILPSSSVVPFVQPVHNSHNWGKPLNHGKYNNVPHTQARKYDKIAYANYLENLNITKGDIIISKALYNGGSVDDRYLYEVLDIEELHYSVEYSGDLNPRSIRVRPYRKVPSMLDGWWTEGHKYVRVALDNIIHTGG